MIRIILGFIIALAFAVAFMPFVIQIANKFKAKQPILHYVESHSVKSGTPTMGGMGIIIAAALPFVMLLRGDCGTALVCLVVAIGYGIIGFTDDFLKVHYKRNEGLSAKAKLILQFVIACLISAYAFWGTDIGGQVLVPFTNKVINFSYCALPYYVFIFLAFTNAVNLTDGLDGLAGGVTNIYLIAFAVVMLVTCAFTPNAGQTNNLVLIACFIGALSGFLCYNRFPARIFMGDTGSLALGGLLASLSVLTGLSLSGAIIGIMYVVTAMSVIIQVLHYKRTKKRVFLMAPLHHHFEKKGVHENHIVTAYKSITALVGAGVVLLTMIFTS